MSAPAFHTIGVEPHIGREFSSEEDAPQGSRVVMLTDSFWRERFSADPAVIGRHLALDGTPYIVIGVMPRNFQFPELAHIDIIVPFQLPNAGLGNRTVFMVDVIGRLRPASRFPWPSQI